jgi:ABC-type multidrug transport system fused ATPase/permease subunit
MFFVLMAFFAMIFSQMLSAGVRLICTREASITQAKISRALYRHTIQMTSEARAGRTIGDTVNLYAQDAGAVVALVDEFLPGMIMSVVPLILAPIFVSSFFDMPLFTVLATSIGFLIVLSLMSWRQSGFFSAFKRLASERLTVVNEWLQNIRIIRILGWITHFEEKIFTKREEETQNRLGMVTNGSTMNSISQVAPLIINVAGVATLVQYKGAAVTAGDIFALLWVFGVFLSRPLRNIPWTLVMFLDGWTSARRLEKFFRLAVESEPASSSDGIAALASSPIRPSASPSVEVRDLSLTLGGKKILDQISFFVPAGSFTVITGEVGSGKTQLLLSLLRDCPAEFGQFLLDGKDASRCELRELRRHFAYVPQDGFVMSGTLRENIAFTYDAPDSLDDQILKALGLADFRMDEEVQEGLATEIGERGVNLSGGQRQRVGLARGWFHRAGVVLLDDCLSAVDVETEKTLVERLLKGAWKDKTRILVTHRLSVLAHADQAFVMENGRLRKVGADV